MNEFPTEEEIKSNQDKLIASLEHGEFSLLDGIMSAQTKALASALGTDGTDMSSLWAMTRQDWSCPACERHKTQIARPNKNNQLMCRLVAHHDHMQELLKKKFEEISISLAEVVADQTAETFAKRSSAMISSFDNTVVCDDCNVADINAKKAAGANRWFSFSPPELKRIIVPKNNLPHKINKSIAIKLWKDAEETFNLRLKIAQRIAEIAANNTHWFQPVNFNYSPSFIESHANNIVSQKQAYGVIDLLTGSKKQLKPTNPSDWRLKHYSEQAQPPSPIQIQHVAKVKAEKQWSKVPENWKCESCNRSKNEIIKITKNNGWNFSLSSRWYRSPSMQNNIEHKTLCSDCGFVAEKLAQEARIIAEKLNGPMSRIVEVKEISQVVMPRPNARHNINNTAATKVIQNILNRLQENNEFW